MTEKAAKILVTGAAGFLGSTLVPKLLNLDHQVVAYDWFLFGKTLAKHARDSRLQIVAGDVRQLDEQLLNDVDAVICLAAISNDPACELSPSWTTTVNRDAVIHLARLCKANGVKRFVFSSSCSVYGMTEGEVSTEDSRLRPVTLYATSKAEAEEALLDLADSAFQPIVLRMSTLYGLAPRMRFDLAVNTMTCDAVMRHRVQVRGHGRQWRPLLHVADAADAYAECVRCDLTDIHERVFNIVGQNLQIRDLAEFVAQRVGETNVEWTDGHADLRDYRVDGSRFAKTFTCKPRHRIDQGIEEVAKALRQGWFDDLDGPTYHTLRMWKQVVQRPAIDGGTACRPSFLPFALPLIGHEEEQEVIDTLRSGWITTGPKTKRFEDKCAAQVGCRHAVAVNSCTAALHLAVAALDIGPGDEVITTPISWPATANVVLHQGATPVFVDVEPDTLNIDAHQIEAAITPRTKAILPVHMAGQPCDLTSIQALAEAHGLQVIEDAAHAIGATYRGQPIGSISRATAFSFYPIKNMTTIEGGLLATDDEQLAERARLLSLHGISKDAWKRYSSDAASLHWQLLEPGFKYNMSDVQAAVGLHQLDRLEGFIATRREYAAMYDQAFADEPAIRPLANRVGWGHAHHLYIVLLNLDQLTLTRDDFLLALKAENIGTGVHFISMHLQPYYQQTFGMQPGDLPVAADVSQRLLSLPLYPKMSKRDVLDVIEAVRKVARAYRSTVWRAKASFRDDFVPAAKRNV